MKKLRLEIMPLGQMGTNCYLLINHETKEMVIVDPGDEPERVEARAHMMQYQPVAILLTHGHFDHIGGVEGLKKAFQIPVIAMEQEKSTLEMPSKNLSTWSGAGYGISADRYVSDGEELDLAGFRIKVIHTPGHTVGGACYYLEEEGVLCSGDTLFRCSVGRTDFPGGSMQQIHDSIHTKLFTLPDETLVYPGHGEETNIHYEKMFNPY